MLLDVGVSHATGEVGGGVYVSCRLVTDVYGRLVGYFEL